MDDSTSSTRGTTSPLTISVSPGQEALWRIYADKHHKGSISAWATDVLREAHPERPPLPDVIFANLSTPHRKHINLRVPSVLAVRLETLAQLWGCEGRAHAMRALMQPMAEAEGWNACPTWSNGTTMLAFHRETTVPALWLSRRFTNMPGHFMREHAVVGYLVRMARVEAAVDRTQSDESIGVDDWLRDRLREMGRALGEAEKVKLLDPELAHLSFVLPVPLGQLVTAIRRIRPQIDEAKLYQGAAAYAAWFNLKTQDADEWKRKFYKSHKSTTEGMRDGAGY